MAQKRFAKLIDEHHIEFAPKNIPERNIFNYDLDEDLMRADGYKEFVPATKEEGKTYTNYRYQETSTKIKELCDLVPDPTPEELYQQRYEQFHREFFNTSLGYIRRTVTKADGSTADFLLDYVALINKAVESGLQYPIITYDEPDFNEDVTDWTQYQHHVYATNQFVLECLAQAGNDFVPVNPA